TVEHERRIVARNGSCGAEQPQSLLNGRLCGVAQDVVERPETPDTKIHVCRAQDDLPVARKLVLQFTDKLCIEYLSKRSFELFIRHNSACASQPEEEIERRCNTFDSFAVV